MFGSLDASTLFSGSRKPQSILDEIEDPGERKAFRALFQTQDAAERRRVAETFLNRYPQSRFLAQGLEIAAKACLELGDHRAALQYGRESIRLLPENPLLLAPLAGVQVQQGDTAEAARNASLALDALDRLTPPSQFSKQDWAVHEAQLRASCYYILGRAAATEGLAASGKAREAKLNEAEESLIRSWRLDDNGDNTAYLLGLVRMAQAKLKEAAVAFAAAHSQGGPFKEKAGEHLRKIHERLPPENRQPFDLFLKNLTEAARESTRAGQRKDTQPARARVSPPDYAGSRSCQSCHAREYAGWAQTGHARMFRPYKFENVFGDFDNQAFEDETGTVVARMTHDEKRHYFDIRDPRGRWHHYPVEYTIGSKWQQTYATRLPSGEIQVFPLQYSRLEKRWLAFWKMIDPPGSERAEVTNFPRLSSDTAYLSNCGPCHTSQLRTKPGSKDPKNFAFAEPGINCEMCHGPSAAHVASMRAARPGFKPPMELLVEFGKTSSRDHVAICAQCHMQSAVREPGPEGEINYLRDPVAFFVRYRSRPYGEFARRAFYRDGRPRIVTFIVESFFRSRCFQRGQAHCGHCHDYHSPDPTNERGLKFLDQPDQMCLQCHAEYASKLETHTGHPAKSEGSRCVACHMPAIMSSVLFKTRTHQIDEIPDAEMTARFGQNESPNACLICHKDKDTEWLRAELKKWRHREGGGVSTFSSKPRMNVSSGNSSM